MKKQKVKYTEWYSAELKKYDKTPAHLMNATKLTRFGERDETNYIEATHEHRKNLAIKKANQAA